MDVEAITNLPLSMRNHQDAWAWHYDHKGIFTVDSAYKMLVHTKAMREAWLEGKALSSHHRKEEKQWTSLWRVKVPSKIKVFLRRLAKHSLPTCDVLDHRNLAKENKCAVCGMEDS